MRSKNFRLKMDWEIPYWSISITRKISSQNISKWIRWSLFRKKRLMLDEMTRQNASKFAIFHVYEKKPNLLFRFYISCYFTFSPNECPGLCQYSPGHSLGKHKVARNEKWKKQFWVFVYIKYGKFWSISLSHFIKHKLLISEGWLSK